MHKSSRDRIAETTKSATSKLKSVGKNLHDRIEMTTNNLSLGRNQNRHNRMPEFDPERPQTVPPNDELFQSISFYSPLSSKTNNCMNINTAESSYEIPKNLRSISSELNSTSAASSSSLPPNPPSYDDIMMEDKKGFPEPVRMTDDVQIQPKEFAPRPAARTKHVKEPASSSAVKSALDNSQRRRTESPSSNSSTEDDGLPCPKFSAPVLDEGLYGKIKAKESEAGTVAEPLSVPVRTKRRKDYEQAEIRLKPDSSADSTRATIDSNEYRTTTEDCIPNTPSRDVSSDFSEKIRLEEKTIPTPSRSESWSYYDINDDQSDGNSTPEPIYANDDATRIDGGATREPVYGVLYSAESPEGTLLTPQAAARKSQYEAHLKEQRSSNRNGCPTDVLKEFDPLDTNALDKIFSNKSNELILLENLLGEETYGPVSDENNFEYHSTEPSDDEEPADVPSPPQRLDSLPEGSTEVIKRDKKKGSSKSKAETDENRPSVIIHQNLNLRSDSLENIVNEANIDQFLAHTDNKNGNSQNVDLSRPAPSKSRWFLGNAESSDKSASTSEKIINKIDDKHMPKGDKCPPPYSEVMAETQSSGSKATSSAPPDKRPASAKSSMKSMFSNVFNKMEGIKRKASFRGQGTKPEVKTVIEMIPRPCLTQRLTLHEGHLIRLPSGVVEDILKEIHSRKAYIRDKKFQAYCDKDMKSPKENIHLEHITTIQCVSNHKFTNNSVDMYCFEITTAISKNSANNLSNPNMVMTSNNSGNTKTQRVCHLYAVAKESERFIWMQKLLDSITDVFPAGFSCKFYRAGWCYLKVNILVIYFKKIILID